MAKKNVPWSLSPERKKVFALYAKRAPKYNAARVAGPDYIDRIVQTAAVAQFTKMLGNIPYAIIGGHAIAIHGNPRMTQDIDLLVAPENLAAAETALGGADAWLRPLTIGGSAMSVNGTEIDLVSPQMPWVSDAIATAQPSPHGRVVNKSYLVLMKLWASRGMQEDADMMSLLKGMTPAEWSQCQGLIRKHLPNDVDDLDNLHETARLIQ